jgi:hypothetical protein
LVVLFGDSHAAYWLPAFEDPGGARRHPRRFLQLRRLRRRRRPTRSDACPAWHPKAKATIIAASPDLVLLGANCHDLLGDLGDLPADDWATALTDTIDEFADAGVDTAIISDTPNPAPINLQYTPAFCLSAHLGSTAICDLPRSSAVNAGFQAAEHELGVPVIDMTDYLCNADTCLAIIGNVFVYRDRSHLTEEAAETLAPVFNPQVMTALAVAKEAAT